MNPTDFPEKHIDLKAPSGMTAEECKPLPIHRTEDGFCISCWEGTEEDKARFLRTGKIWLYVMSGATQPPVYVGTENPFGEPPAVGIRKFIIAVADKMQAEVSSVEVKNLDDSNPPPLHLSAGDIVSLADQNGELAELVGLVNPSVGNALHAITNMMNHEVWDLVTTTSGRAFRVTGRQNFRGRVWAIKLL